MDSIRTCGVYKRCARGAPGGFSLVELLIGTVVGTIVLVGVLTTYLQLTRSGLRIQHYAEMNTQARRALEQFAGDARMASGIKWNGASDITLTVPTLAGSTRQVTYAWTAASQAFFMVAGADSTVTAGRIYLQRGIPTLADGSAGLVFARYDRNDAAAATDAATKSVQVSMNLARTSPAGTKATDTVVSAVFVLRNKPVS